MQLVNTDTRYGVLPQVLHWATVICVVAGWLLGQFIDDFPKGVACDFAFATHVALGEFVLVLLAVRLLWRFANRPPALLPTRFGRAGEIAATFGHYALYALLLAVPIVGIVAQLKREQRAADLRRLAPSVAVAGRSRRRAQRDGSA